ncbi:peptide-methionine (R)-S-oxide reductase MsrB [Marivita sp. S6314]|uniref:peptide-methionine (R)-S-oxide reductase MsrB n=1 Tax=Marivita sp. S6314 TaxID=2926406 RepID=UPI001FF56CE6|nr:peptide-methionine (R)-S-oxide reductase MsrB [Marivita sp. S6314]MCK0149358.1 peptide-methionine (R)-S-oxide reductase MsrB [Marivita sp. S6314]
MIRRQFLQTAAAALGFSASAKAVSASKGSFEITRSDAEWKAMLNAAEYRVMREHGTERAFSSPLDRETRRGMFHCKGCDLALYSSEHKFDSGTGWPSFWQAQANAIGTKQDRSFFMLRTECHCRRCGSHLGHIFDDGPQPTGKRHCINGVSLTFRAA